MENKKKKSTGLLLSILGVVSLVLITAGVTYAFFSYAKEGQTTNTLTTATIEFTYNEIDNNSNGILIQNALPLSDTDGMKLGGDTQDHTTLASNRNVFLFTVTSKTPTNANIPYIVTAKKQAPAAGHASLADSQVKLYLTATQSGTNNTVVSNVVQTFAQLKTAKPLSSDQTVFSSLTGVTASADEVVLFEGTVPNSSSSYTNSFVLRMWINGDTQGSGVDYSPYEFVLNSQVTAAGNTALSVATLKGVTNGIKKSVDYYALPAATEQSPATGDGTHREDYQRIAYVNNADGTIYTVNQTPSWTDSQTHDGYTASEQYYELSDAEFTVKVNVYANAAVYTAPANNGD